MTQPLDPLDPVGALEAMRTELEVAQCAAAPAASLTDLCARMPGRHLRVSTGIDGLDVALRGGFRTGSVTVLGGQPGINKTSLIARTLHNWGRMGVKSTTGPAAVLAAIVAADETRGGYLSRWAQMGRTERDALDDEDLRVSVPAWARAAEYLSERGGDHDACGSIAERVRLHDPREENITVESVAQALLDDPRPIARRVLVIDSLHSKAGWACDDPSADKRTQIDTRTSVLMKLAAKGLCVIALAELNRGAYRHRPGESPVVALLASFKESGGIEYCADQALVLSKVHDGGEPVPGQIDVYVAKTRFGEVDTTVRLQRGPWLSFAEIGIPEPVPVDDLHDAAINDFAVKIETALARRRQPVGSKNGLVALIKGQKARKLEAVDLLIAEERIAFNGKFYCLSGVGGSEVAEPVPGTGSNRLVPGSPPPVGGKGNREHVGFAKPSATTDGNHLGTPKRRRPQTRAVAATEAKPPMREVRL